MSGVDKLAQRLVPVLKLATYPPPSREESVKVYLCQTVSQKFNIVLYLCQG